MAKWLVLACALLALASCIEAKSGRLPPRRKQTVGGKVYNGVAVTNARIFPYVASIYYTPASGTGAAYLGCTGTIIHATTVLTAARCVTDTQGNKVVPAYLLATNAVGDVLRAEVDSVDWMDDFSGWYWRDEEPQTITNIYNNFDVAVIKLKNTPFVNAQMIKIVNPDDFAAGNVFGNMGVTDVVPNQLLAVAGFGITAPGGAGGKLNTATVAFVSSPIPTPGANCDTTRCTQLLAGNVPTSSGLCEGDYGAPLLMWNAAFVGDNGQSQGIPASRDPQNQRQLAIYSNGPPCGQPFSTSFYTDLRISQIRDWINIQMNGASGWQALVSPWP